MSKFTGITFPFYGITEVPVKIEYSLTKINITMEDTRFYLLDDKSYPQKTYIGRLLVMDAKSINRLIFKYTVINLQQLILLPQIKWGVDNIGKIFNLSKKEKFSYKLTNINTNNTTNLLRLKGISYPFEVPYGIAKSISKYDKVCIVKVNNRWYIHKIISKYINKKEIYI